MLLPEEEKMSDELNGTPSPELEQKAAPPIDSNSGSNNY